LSFLEDKEKNFIIPNYTIMPAKVSPTLNDDLVAVQHQLTLQHINRDFEFLPTKEKILLLILKQWKWNGRLH
ncbi:hypothetical protein GOODEAATRI_022164, partial [Goodea atripinnis]